MTTMQNVMNVPNPAWRPLADAIFQHLRGDPDAEGAVEPAKSTSSDDDDVLAMTPEQLDAWVDTPSKPAPRPARRISPRLRLALLRLCAGLGTEEVLVDLIRPGAITVIDGVPPTMLNTLAELLRVDLADLASRLAEVVPPAGGALEVLKPSICEGKTSPADMRRLEDRLLDVIEGTRPVAICLPRGTSASAALLATEPLRLRLAPLDPSILAMLLRHVFSEATEDDLGRAVEQFPSADVLATLPEMALLGALRAGDLAGCVRRLAGLRPRNQGPQLADLPDTPAARAARDLVQGLRDWQDGRAPWSEMSHSILLHGPAGTGKTYIARAMASEPDLRLVTGGFGEWQAAGHLGDMLGAMRQTFALAVEAAPCVLFIDEIDSAGTRSGGDRNGQNYRRNVINSFLMEIDQLNAAEGVLLVGACNDPEALDPAVLRPGRLDRHVEVPMPDRRAIASVLRRGLGASIGDDEISGLAGRLAGKSMAAVDGLIREAKSAARRKGRSLELGDLEGILPPQATAAQRWRIAVHESGHAIVATALRQGTITRITMSNGGGLTERSVSEFAGVSEEFDGLLAIHTAGRAAEAVILGNIGAGSGGSADSDLGQATRIALSLETELGLGSLGPIWLEGASLSNRDLQQRVRQRIEAAEARAKDIVTANKDHLLAIAEVLRCEDELSGPRLAELLVPVSAQLEALVIEPFAQSPGMTATGENAHLDRGDGQDWRLNHDTEADILGEEIVSA